MISQRHSEPVACEPSLGPKETGADELGALTSALRVAVGERADWRDTARLVASALELHLPSPNILTAAQRTGDPESYRSEVLHAEPDGSFSIVKAWSGAVEADRPVAKRAQ